MTPPVLTAHEVAASATMRRWVGTKIGPELGSGEFGTAFRAGRGRVLKLTRDFDEVSGWRLVAAVSRREPSATRAFLRVHRVARLEGVLGPDTEGGDNEWNAVLRDRLVEPLEWDQRADADEVDLPPEWEDWWDRSVGLDGDYWVFGGGRGAVAWHRLAREPAWRTFVRSIDILQGRWGLVFEDLRWGNLGFDSGGNIRCYDFRVFTARRGTPGERLWNRLPKTRRLHFMG